LLLSQILREYAALKVQPTPRRLWKASRAGQASANEALAALIGRTRDFRKALK
jgi:hypothetical protein